eukprot:CAMPEP_0179868098 /NCGR_PEP_ID=MMETSP0982-20121206/18601_1 /TAXON_ID=483367 /ORGANISM="non described non described, Strain CCMP 2436" /LENGTH=185 /DNA_ID=CAMNT_0021757659 /DNA_START=301 /DNA_END=855 /DNA_ORIENTATION=-
MSWGTFGFRSCARARKASALHESLGFHTSTSLRSMQQHAEVHKACAGTAAAVSHDGSRLVVCDGAVSLSGSRAAVLRDGASSLDGGVRVGAEVGAELSTAALLTRAAESSRGVFGLPDGEAARMTASLPTRTAGSSHGAAGLPAGGAARTMRACRPGGLASSRRGDAPAASEARARFTWLMPTGS